MYIHAIEIFSSEYFEVSVKVLSSDWEDFKLQVCVETLSYNVDQANLIVL